MGGATGWHHSGHRGSCGMIVAGHLICPRELLASLVGSSTLPCWGAPPARSYQNCDIAKDREDGLRVEPQPAPDHGSGAPVAVGCGSSRDSDDAHPADGLNSARGGVSADGLPRDTKLSRRLGNVARFLVVTDQVI